MRTSFLAISVFVATVLAAPVAQPESPVATRESETAYFSPDFDIIKREREGPYRDDFSPKKRERLPYRDDFSPKKRESELPYRSPEYNIIKRDENRVGYGNSGFDIIKRENKVGYGGANFRVIERGENNQ